MITESKIKILFIIGSFGTGGKERQLAELIKGLSKEYFEIHLIVKSEGGYYLDDIKENLHSYRSLKSGRFNVKAFWIIINYIILIKPQIVHSWANIASLFSILASALVKQKYITIDGSIRMAPQVVCKYCLKNLHRKIINYYSKIITGNSKAGLKAFQAPDYKSSVIYNGFDMNRLSNLKNPELVKKEFGIISKNGWVAYDDAENYVLGDSDWVTGNYFKYFIPH